MTTVSGFARLLGPLKRRLGRLITDILIGEKWKADSAALNIDPELWPLYVTCHKNCYRQTNRFPNIVEPRNFNDCIQWLILFDQDEEHIICSDKFAVREFVTKHVGEKYLTKLYGVFNTADAIKPDALPEAFVIKTNHDSGSVVLVNQSQKPDWPAIMSKVRASLGRRYGAEMGEWNYSHITPLVMIEEHLSPNSAASPPDYKFHCVDGRVKFIEYIFDRRIGPKEVVFDRDWERLPIRWYFPLSDIAVPKPPNFDEMLHVAETLSAQFKYVRIDLYNLDGRIVFGEMTFFPVSGSYRGYHVYQVAPFMTFDRATRKPPISNGARRLA